MTKSSTFWTLVSVSVFILLVLFYWIGHNVKPVNSSKVEAVITKADEIQFVNDVKILDTLLIELRKAVYAKDKSKIVEVKVEWKKYTTVFKQNHRQNKVLETLVNIVLKNYEQRIDNFKVNLKEKLRAADEIETVSEAIKANEAKKEELKIENQMLKQAILNQ